MPEFFHGGDKNIDTFGPGQTALLQCSRAAELPHVFAVAANPAIVFDAVITFFAPVDSGLGQIFVSFPGKGIAPIS